VRRVWPFLEACLEKTAWDAPRQVVARTHTHPCKQAYGDDIVEILDGTEGKVETPSNVDVRHACWSQYKHDYTWKVLIGIRPFGGFSFKSNVWGGRLTDNHTITHSNILRRYKAADKVVADKGYTCHALFTNIGATLVTAPRKVTNGNVLPVQATDDSCSQTSVRIHVERMMRSLKQWQIQIKQQTKSWAYVKK